MSDAEIARYTVFNERDQPVELHLPDRVLSLGPREQVELDASAVASPQLDGLRRQGLLGVYPVEASAASETSKAARASRAKKSDEVEGEGD